MNESSVPPSPHEHPAYGPAPSEGPRWCIHASNEAGYNCEHRLLGLVREHAQGYKPRCGNEPYCYACQSWGDHDNTDELHRLYFLRCHFVGVWHNLQGNLLTVISLAAEFQRGQSHGCQPDRQGSNC